MIPRFSYQWIALLLWILLFWVIVIIIKMDSTINKIGNIHSHYMEYYRKQHHHTETDLLDSEHSINLQELLQMYSNHTISYNPFNFNFPQFASAHDYAIFLKLEEKKFDNIIQGNIEIIPNGTVHKKYDCGWKTSTSFSPKLNLSGINPIIIFTHYYLSWCPILMCFSISWMVSFQKLCKHGT